MEVYHHSLIRIVKIVSIDCCVVYSSSQSKVWNSSGLSTTSLRMIHIVAPFKTDNNE